MGQSAQTKMKNKKRTNNTTSQDGTKERQLTGPSVTVNLKVSKSESECRAIEVVNVENSRKAKTSSKAKVVLKPEDFGMQQLSVLATMGDVENTRALFDADDQRDPNERVECDGSTPLILAADKKHVEIVKVLLEHGADCTLTNNEGNNALMTAIKAGDAEVINAIWPHRASVNLNHANKHGYTALHYAADRRWECCVQFLLGNGASPDCQTNNGETPLMIAAKLGDKKSAERLVQAKADILIGDKNDLTAICKAMEHSKTEVLAYLLDKLSDEDAEVFLRAKLYYIKHPDDQCTLDDMYTFRLLIRLTRKPMLRDVFYSQKVVSVVLDRMKEARQCPPDMLQLSALLCSIMFMFNKQPDVKLIKQYIYAGGPDFSTEIVKYYLGKMNVGASEAIVSYLPIIGITEAPEGNAWLRKNAMRLLEFSSYFHAICEWKLSNLLCSMNDKLVDLDPDFSKVLTPVWKSFHSTIFDIQKKQREKTLMELIKEEEREKEKKEKREKKNQKRRTEKVRKVVKPEDSGDIQETVAVVQLDTPSADSGPVKATNLSQNSNDNENDSASRADMKNRKKQKAKRMINYGLDNDLERLNETSEVYPENDFIENQIVNFSTSPGSWTTVQTKKHTCKEKDKFKDKQELTDVKTENLPTPKKSQIKTPKKAQDRRRLQRDRNHGHHACWADVAKGTSAAKLPNKCNLDADDVSGFSYEDDFPTLTGTKRQTEINDSKPQSKMNKQPCNSGYSPEDYQKGSSTYNSDASGNPSTQSGLSLNSFCEIEPCSPDEKYYSDDEVLGYSHQHLSEDVTYAGWEELADINNTSCSAEAYSTGQNAVRQMNSDTLQYLVDAYIASSGNSEPVEKFDSDASSQNFQSVSQDSDDKIEEPLSSDQDTRYSEGNDVKHTTGDIHLKTEMENEENNGFRAYENKFWHEETSNSENFDTVLNDCELDIHITQTAYARDPSPTKSPRKRFVPHKDNKVLQSRHDRTAAVRKEHIQNSNQGLHSKDDSFVAQKADGKVQQLPVQFLDHTISGDTEGSKKEQSEQISFGWDDEQPQEEELPAWYTDSGPPNASYNLNEVNETVQNAYDECQDYARQMWGVPSDQINKPGIVGFVKSNSVPDDDIASDPCVVQYWTQPHVSAVRHGFTGQSQTEMNEPVSRPIPDTDIKSSLNAEISSQQHNIHDSHERQSGCTKDVFREDSGNKTTKKTAVVKPINPPTNPQWQHARNSVNCALGQSILENACRIDTTPDEVLYPSDLRGSPEPEPREPDYFPSFHEDTRLSADYHPDAISVFHKIQQMQLTQLKNYYDAFHSHLQEKMAVYQNDFHYYASCIGLTEQQINEHLGISQQQQCYPENGPENLRYQGQFVATENTCYVNPVGSNRRVRINDARLHYNGQRDVCTHTGEQLDHQNRQNARNDQNVPASTERAQTSAGYHAQPVQTNQMANQRLEDQELNAVGIDTNLTADELKVLAARGIADRALEDIKAAYNAMVTHAIKSRRWRDKLLDIRHMPAADINMFGNIVFPKVNQARYIMASRPDTVMLGFLLNGTPVAVRIVNRRSRHLIRDDLQRLVDLDVSKYFMSKYKAFSFLNGNYYIAMDLYEYTLEEYLYKLKTDGQDSPLCTNKLVWQFLRGLNSIHQQCLMVHSEIRPSNIVLDVSGNLRITGYGLGRKITTDSTGISEEEKGWMAPEILLQEQGDSFKADIWSAGMIMYFILSGGKQPPGTDPRDIVWNLSRRNLRLESVSEEAFHLLSVMMSLNKAERPATSEALRHPYFWAEEKRLRFVLIAGSDVLRDLKMGIPMTGGPGDSMIDILNSVQSSALSDWMCEVDAAVLKEMRTFRQYKNSVVELVLFVYNCCLHFEKMSGKAREIIDEPCKYFLTRFPTLFMTVYGAIKRSNRTEKTCYKPFF